MKKKTGIRKLERISRLPTPSIHYQSFLLIGPDDSSIGAVALLGESKNKILFSDEAVNTSIYITELRCLTATPILNSPKVADCVAVSIPGAAARAISDSGDHSGNLFLLDMHRHTSCFEVLGFDSMGKWRWSALPPPPFMEERDYMVPLVVGGNRICVSTTTVTYSFDTVTHVWNKVVNNWVHKVKHLET